MLLQRVAEVAHFHSIVGTSQSMLRIYDFVRSVSSANVPVLILGESGTGKELIARAIHEESPRKDKPFLAVNCPATAHHLWESEMFGHEQGAFTGAVAVKRGRFECAHGGTLLLDEISEMPLSLQVKLLRVLQEMTFERVGGTRSIKVDVRIIAATNRDLKMGIEEGWFREDLFFRLNVITIRVPPLRERKEDIGCLLHHFLEKYIHRIGREIRGISYEAVQALTDYRFPGNVRELENIVMRAIVLAKGPEITVHDLPEEVSNGRQSELDALGPVKAEKLSRALRRATVSDNGGPHRLWHETLQCVTPETILEFLLESAAKPFSRLEFAEFLRYKAKSEGNKYGTAGKYLSVLKNNQICIHNNKKANQSRYRLSEVFLS